MMKEKIIHTKLGFVIYFLANLIVITAIFRNDNKVSVKKGKKY